MGIVALIGPSAAVKFFVSSRRMLGSAFYFAGFILIVIGWWMFTTIGFSLQMYGLWVMFRQFLPTLFDYMQTVPFVGPMIRN